MEACDGSLLIMFQSRAGFSGFCDRVVRGGRGTDSEFQSRAGFSGFCDRPVGPTAGLPRSVSIPCWVFWVLRRNDVLVADLDVRPRFQSRAGFSGFCDSCIDIQFTDSCIRFNPVLGFLGSATGRTKRFQSSVGRGFNPVLGFLGSATRVIVHLLRAESNDVSIPCWVFWVLRLVKWRSKKIRQELFQSRAGFSGFCDNHHVAGDDCECQVSIPCWVFWVLRPR